jgi:hypothetical protein
MLTVPATASPDRLAEDERTTSTRSISSAGMRSTKKERSTPAPGTSSPSIRILV